MSAIHPTLHKALLAGSARVPLEKDPAQLCACSEIGVILQSGQAAATAPDNIASGAAASGAAASGAGIPAPNPALLWHALAANDLWQRAGFQPVSINAMAPAPPDTRACPPAAEQILHLILRGIHPELLETWLARAHAAGARLPHQFLVKLLDDAMNKPHLRPLLTPLLDARGHWLIAQHPAWSKRYGTVDADDIDGQWQHGNSIDRARALRVLRERDAAQALQLLQADWASEAPESRSALLPCLAVKLSLADEAFLEQALDDKRKEVRSAACALLRSLPDSQLMQRCAAQLQTLFKIERKSGLAAQIGGFLSKLTHAAPAHISLEVTLPEECSKAMKRDGIGAQKMPTLGEKAGWLYDLMRSVAPGHWCRTWELTPAQVLALLEEQEFKTALTTGITQAAASALQYRVDDQSTSWFALLLTRIGQGWQGFDYAILPDLMQHFALLPPASQETLLLDWLKQSGAPAKPLAAGDGRSRLGIVNPAQSLLNQWSQQRASNAALSPTLSRAFFSHAQQALTAQTKDYSSEWEIRHRFKQLGEWLDISDLRYTEQGWPGSGWSEWPHWVETIDKFQETLRFRHQLESSFLENPQ